MKYSLFYFFVCVSFLLCEQSVAQPRSNAGIAAPCFRHFSADQGFSENDILFILQGGKSFLWFGTSDRFNHYYGYRFTVYFLYLADSFSIRDNIILVSSQGHPWYL